MSLRRFAIGVFVGLLGGVISGHTSESPGPADRRDVLTRAVAEARSKQIEGLNYGFWLSFDPARPTFQGRATVRFTLKEGAESVSKTLPLELKAAEIESVTLNGARWKSEEVSERYSSAAARLTLEVADLRRGENRLEISYSAAYGVPGFGLQRWVDSKDQSVYLTGTFEPFSAHWVVPVFDQPDLKGVYELTVEAPKDWVVVSGTREREVQVQGGKSHWVFPPTKPMSAYALSLHAGPFRVFKSEAKGVDLRLLVRKSLQSGIVPTEWWDVLGRGIGFYQARFAFPLPAPKLDVVLVPEGPGQANESTGTLVFEETELKLKANERRRTVLKELAQLWFGNLVSMRWWNGLWLKEALSGFAAQWALEQEWGDSSVALEFVTTGKAEALYADRSPEAHPVDVSVKDTDEILPNLDVFTQEKGMALLRQVFSWVEEDGFQETLQRYFARYAHRVTTLGDFAHALEEAADLKEGLWRRSWLQTAGHPLLAAEWSCRPPTGDQASVPGARGTLEKLVVRQLQKTPRWFKVKAALLGVPETLTPEGGRKKRRHRGQGGSSGAAGFQARGDLFPRMIDVAGATAVVSVSKAEGLPCPLGVLLDPRAEVFVETRLDPKTDAFLAGNGERALWLEPVVRAGVWQSRLDSVLRGESPVRPAVETVVRAFKVETDPWVRQLLFQGLVGSGKSRHLGLLRILPETERRELGARLKGVPGLASRWPLVGLTSDPAQRASLEAQVRDPKAEPGEQWAAAERLAAIRFWSESGEPERKAFEDWLKLAQQALAEVDRGADPGPRFGGDEERIEELAEWLWPFSCENRADQQSVTPVPGGGGGPVWLQHDLGKKASQVSWEASVCAQLRTPRGT